MVSLDARLYPLEPLMDAADRHRYISERRELYSSHTSRGGWWDQPSRAERLEQTWPATGYRVLLEVCGLTRRNLMTIRARGGLLTEAQADQCAIRLGRHPSEIWGWQWWDGEGARDTVDILFAGIRREVG